MSSFDKTWIGYRPAPHHGDDRAEDDRAEDDRAEDDRAVDRTVQVAVDPAEASRPPDSQTTSLKYTSDSTDHAVFTADMVEELRRRLRDAEARESSGVREMPAAGPTRGREAILPPERSAQPPSIFEAFDGPCRATTVEVAPLAAAVDAACEARLEASAEVDLDIDLHVDLASWCTADTDLGADTEPAAGGAATGLDAVIGGLLELEVALAPNSDSNFYAGFDQLAPDGVFVATYQRLDLDTPVYVNVLLPAGYRFRAAAIVEWVRPPEAATEAASPPGFGLRLCGLDPEMRRLIRTFARHRAPMFYVD